MSTLLRPLLACEVEFNIIFCVYGVSFSMNDDTVFLK